MGLRLETRSTGVVAVVDGGVPAVTATVVLVTDHPAVVSLLDDAGIDYRDIAFWRRPQGIQCWEQLRSGDPPQVTVVVTVEDERLTPVMDEQLEVVERHRKSV